MPCYNGRKKGRECWQSIRKPPRSFWALCRWLTTSSLRQENYSMKSSLPSPICFQISSSSMGFPMGFSLPMGFPRQEHSSRLPFPSPGDHPDAGIQPRSPALQMDSLWSEPPGKPKSMQRFHKIP